MDDSLIMEFPQVEETFEICVCHKYAVALSLILSEITVVKIPVKMWVDSYALDEHVALQRQHEMSLCNDNTIASVADRRDPTSTRMPYD